MAATARGRAMMNFLAVLSGCFVGFSLGLVGGGGSILAVPLLLYIVGVREPHIAIGTSALAVAANAFVNVVSHWRAGNVKWSCALTFAAFGLVGAWAGSTLGKVFDGQKLLFLFALLMIVVGIAMLRRRGHAGNPDVHLNKGIAVRLATLGLAAGALSGFFGIGGGFLIVPGLMLGSGMPLLSAIGSSLIGVGVFGLTTAVNYALSGLIDWKIASEFVLGGAFGGWFGMQLAMRLASHRTALNYVFAGIIFTVAIYMLIRTGMTLAA
jgi:uncharacterized membrane protein YfcA